MSKSAAGLRGRTMEVLAQARPASLDRGAEASYTKTAGVLAAARAAGEEPAPSQKRAGTAGPSRIRGAAWAALAGTGLAVAVAAVIATAGGGAGPGGLSAPAPMADAALVQRMASASVAALARSGQVKVSYAEIDGRNQATSGVEDVMFSGRNWNGALSQSLPAGGGGPESRQFAVNRVVGGRFYLYSRMRDGRLGWVRDTNPAGHPSMEIPDPRSLLDLLKPAAGFRFAGYHVVGGIRLKELRATRPGALPTVETLRSLAPAGRLTQLAIWVDRHNVVRRMSLRAQWVTWHWTGLAVEHLGANGPFVLLVPNKRVLAAMAPQIRKMRRHTPHLEVRVLGKPSVRRRSVMVTQLQAAFWEIGKPEVINAPRHAVPVYLRG